VVEGLPAEWGMCSRTVELDTYPWALSSWKDTIAIGPGSRDIIILDAITGSQVAVFCGHANSVGSVIFSLDGTLLVSGSDDNTLKLWDVQTGGVIKTFYGHTNGICSVSISPDCTMIASGSQDCTIRLWSIQTGECLCVIEQQGGVGCVSFSPADPQYLISVSGDVIQEWDINGHQVGPAYNGSCAAFSLDGTSFVSCGEEIGVQNSDSVASLTKYHVPGCFEHCCFTPDGRLVVTANGSILYIWDIAGLDPHLIKTIDEHIDNINSLAFSSSSLISASDDRIVKFWQIDLLMDPVASNPKSVTPSSNSITSDEIRFISLQTEYNIAISVGLEGVVKTWDISTGLCKMTFQIPIEGRTLKGAQMIDDMSTFAWLANKKVHLWDIEEGKLLQTIDELDLSTQGQDSKTPGSSPTPNHLHFINNAIGLMTKPSVIVDTVTGKEVFRLYGRYVWLADAKWDGWYLVAGYRSGEVLILDFNHLLLQ
jgi:WD40 repeat protein